MSTVDQIAQATEIGSSVKLTRNAKGDTQIELKTRTNEEPGALEAAVAQAQELYDALCTKYPIR